MTNPVRIEFGVGVDVYGRTTRLIGEHQGGVYIWSIVSDPVSQRDEGERIRSLTTGQLVELGRIAATFGKAGSPKPQPYDYVRRFYGVDPVIGRRVRLEDTSFEGVIVRRRTYDHRVWVRFDGLRHASPCHPKSLVYLPETLNGPPQG